MSVRRSLGIALALAVLLAIAIGFPVERVALALVLPCIVVFGMGTMLGSEELQRGAVRVGAPALILGMVLPGLRTLLWSVIGDVRVRAGALGLLLVSLAAVALVFAGRGLLALPRGPWRPLRAPRALIVEPDFSSVRPAAPAAPRSGDDLQLFAEPSAGTAPPPPAEAEPPPFIVFRRGGP